MCVNGDDVGEGVPGLGSWTNGGCKLAMLLGGIYR